MCAHKSIAGFGVHAWSVSKVRQTRDCLRLLSEPLIKGAQQDWLQFSQCFALGMARINKQMGAGTNKQMKHVCGIYATFI